MRASSGPTATTVEFSEEERALRERARRFDEEHVTPNAMAYVESEEWPWEP